MSRVVRVKISPAVKRDWLAIFELASANLWSRKINQNRQRSIQLFGRRPRAFDVLGFLFARAVRHVDAHAIRAGLNQAFNNRLITRGGSQRRQNLCFPYLFICHLPLLFFVSIAASIAFSSSEAVDC